MKTTLNGHSLADLKFLLAGTRCRVVQTRGDFKTGYSVQMQDGPDHLWRTAARFGSLPEMFACGLVAACLTDAAQDTELTVALKLREIAAEILGRAEVAS